MSSMSYKRTHYALFLIFGVIFLPTVSFASEQDVRAQCFSTLKENMSEAKIFETPLVELQKISYQELEPKFSTYYKNLASFGLEIDRGDFEMRLYSFGRQTGYIHPVDHPVPVSTKSDKWEEPAKEFIVAEEFIISPEGNRIFLNCVFFVIESENLLNVTSEKYLYDGEAISLTKVPKEPDYKAWYYENTSFDYSSRPFVSWKRLFIYPELTKNDYFNRYDVAEVFPSNKVESFSILNFFQEVVFRAHEYDDINILKVVYFNEKGEKIYPPKELLPVVVNELNTSFPLSTYYQAIENIFPFFAERLALRGTLKYDTYKKLTLVAGSNKEAASLLSVINDYRNLAAYSLDKKEKEKAGIIVSNVEKDKLLALIGDAEPTAQQLIKETEIQEPEKNGTNAPVLLVSLALAVTTLLIMRYAVVFLRKA